jgi:hypothetical protein
VKDAGCGELLEEYGPELHYIKGEHNIVADALSRLDMVKEPITEPLLQEAAATLFAGDELEFDFPQDFPLSYAEIQHRQEQDKYIKKRLQESDEEKKVFNELFADYNRNVTPSYKGSQTAKPGYKAFALEWNRLAAERFTKAYEKEMMKSFRYGRSQWNSYNNTMIT